MQFFSFSIHVFRGEIFRLTMVTGKMLIVFFAVGETAELEKEFLKFLYPNYILNGL